MNPFFNNNDEFMTHFSDDTASDTQVIKWAKNDAKLLEGREPNIFPGMTNCAII